jgi:Zn-dependent protease with chaperone function
MGDVLASIVLVCALLGSAALSPRVGHAQTAGAAVPASEAEIQAMLAAEPFSLQSWPTWRGRLLAWMGDNSEVTAPAYEASWEFMKSQTNGAGILTGDLANDAFAWYLLGTAQLHDGVEGNNAHNTKLAANSLRNSLTLDDSFARSHRRLAECLMRQPEAQPGTPLYLEAQQQLARAKEIDPSLPINYVEAQAAVVAERWYDAIPALQRTLAEEPTAEWAALALANAELVANSEANHPNGNVQVRDDIALLVQQFPGNDPIRAMYAVALAQAGDLSEAAEELKTVRSHGASPEEILNPEVVAKIEELARPGLSKIAGYVAAGFVACYAVIGIAMAVTGIVLARFTRGDRATELLGDSAALVTDGRVARTGGESLMARLYGMALMGGLLMFYVAIPFVIAGLVAATLGALFAVLSLPRIPIKLLVIIGVVGFSMAWVVLKSLFTRASESSGLPLGEGEHPRLQAVIGEVAQAVNTPPVDKVYLSPGAEIGVHQDGRGPFGMLGVKDRVLTLGMASLQFLSVDQLRSILAHEYAHFSHGDTFYSRFIHQVTASIHHSLHGMAETAGRLNYVKPFYWFLYLYYRAYEMMAAGFSRSREFLADRMAVSLYGRDVFESALTTVATKASVAHGRIFRGVISDLELNQYVPNAYDTHRLVPDGAAAEELTKVREELLNERGTLFASHPTLSERFQAIASYRPAVRTDARPARELLDEPEAVEQELTKLVNAFFHHLRQLQMGSS